MSFPSIPKDVNQIPISSIYIPGVGFVALQGTNSSTDGSGNPSAGVVAALYGKVTNPGDTPLLLDSSGRVLIGNITQSDTFSNATNLTAATTFSGTPTISQLAANSSVLLANPGNQATFIAEIAVASAFVGTLSFYGLEPDGTTLQLISAHQRNATTIANNTAISTAVALNQVWMGSAANFKTIYVVCTAFTSGSASVQLGLSAAPYALAILNTANVSVSNANANGQATMANSAPVVIASDQTAVKSKGDFLEQASLSAGSLNADLIPSTDISAYEAVSLHVLNSAFSGSLVWRGSNDNVNWYQFNSIDINTATAYINSATGPNIIVFLPRLFRYLRVRMESYSSGTATAVAEFYTTSPIFIPQKQVGQSGTWTVQPGNTQNTTPWVVKKATNNGTQAANTAANSVIKGSAGVLWSATVTTLGTAALSIFDNATTNSGTILLTIPASAAVGTIYTWQGGQPAANGITSAGVTNCPGVTFAYGPA